MEDESRNANEVGSNRKDCEIPWSEEGMIQTEKHDNVAKPELLSNTNTSYNNDSINVDNKTLMSEVRKEQLDDKLIETTDVPMSELNRKIENDDDSDGIESDSKKLLSEIRREHIKKCKREPKTRQKLCEKSDSDSDGDEPLSEIRERQIRKTLFRCDEDEDSIEDPVFKMKADDLNSSDSEYESIMTELKQSPSMKKIIRDKAWKKKTSTLSKHKRNTPGWPEKGRKRIASSRRTSLNQAKKQRNNRNNVSTEVKPVQKSIQKNLMGKSSPKERDMHQYAIEKAKTESIRQQRALDILRRFHEKTLDALLNSNGLQRYKITRDGNCFFASILKSSNLTQFKTPMELRETICDYMYANKDTFKPFLTNDSSLSNEEYLKQVDYLRVDGNWSNGLSDSLPLAAANVIGRDIKIFTSDRKQPIIQVNQSVRPKTSDEMTNVALGYIKMRGVEHYDACIRLEKQSTEKNKPVKQSQLGTNPTETDTPAKQSKTAPIPDITPRKQAAYNSPVRKKRTRKRKANPEKWQKNVRKQLQLSGQKYTSSTGKKISAKEVREVNCSKCRFKCTSNISRHQREDIFTKFWTLKSYERQKDFLCNNITESSPKRKLCNAKFHRSSSCIFSFTLDGVGDIRVCKTFFLKTLDISERSIESAMKNKEAGVFVSCDNRGRHGAHNKISDDIIDGVRQHIESFPTIEAHYTRKATNKLYLGPELNIAKMYDLYKEKCQSNGSTSVSKGIYRKVFCEEYNLSFHKPKKDQCQTCAVYQDAKSKGTTSPEMDYEFSEHMRRKEQARREKEFDKKFAKEHSNYHTAVFDLEAVLPVPCSLVSQVYYKRKLNCYNLSVFSLGDAKTSCYVWNETEANRGSCEIASCLQMYLRSLPEVVSHVCLFPDSCPGQNRNRVMASALWNAVTSHRNISVIDQKFLESGHTQMEVDSVHAAIERAKKATSVYVPSQWDTVIRLAQKKNPYSVIPLKYSDILDFKSLSNTILPCNLNDCNGQKVQWMKIKWIQYRKREPDSIFFKYKFDASEFTSIKIRQTRRASASVIQACYSEKRPISDAKKADLLSLCRSGIIPTDFHAYYENLKLCKDSIEERKSEEGYTDDE